MITPNPWSIVGDIVQLLLLVDEFLDRRYPTATQSQRMEKCEKNKVAENRKGNDMSPPCFFKKKDNFQIIKKGKKQNSM